MADEPTSDRPTEPDATPAVQPDLAGDARGHVQRVRDLGRGILRHIPSNPRCKLCASPFAGPGAPFMRMIDRGPWAKSPNICGFCFKQLEKSRGGAEIELSLLFADVRGSTGLAESMGAEAFRRLLERFYHRATDVLLARDAILDKFVGDEVVALFIPALAGTEHPRRAVDAARDLLKVTGHGRAPRSVGRHSASASTPVGPMSARSGTP